MINLEPLLRLRAYLAATGETSTYAVTLITQMAKEPIKAINSRELLINGAQTDTLFKRLTKKGIAQRSETNKRAYTLTPRAQRVADFIFNDTKTNTE